MRAHRSFCTAKVWSLHFVFCVFVALPVATLDAIFNCSAISLPKTQVIIEGITSHILYKLVNGDVFWQTGYSPVGYNPQRNQGEDIVVSDITKSAIIVVEPVKDRLGKCHDDSWKANYRCRGRLNTMSKINVNEVKDCFHNIHKGYSGNQKWVKTWIHSRRTLSISETVVLL